MHTTIIRAMGPVLLLLMVSLAHGSLGTSMQGQYFSSADIASQLAHTVDGQVFKEVAKNPESSVIISRREKTGDVEVHSVVDDVIFAEAGHATVTVGGQVTGNHQTEPNEWRGGEQSGGRDYSLAPGDLLLIPAGSPHRVAVAPNGSFTYLIVKTPVRQ
jgi:quercetin dioxygenase-like cupin family protein